MSKPALAGKRPSIRQVRSPLHLVVLSGLLSCVAATAQSDTGSIIGFVKDASGAIVPKANITLRNEGTAETRSLSTNDGGYYAAPNLPPGYYAITAEASGFKRFQSTHNKLESNSALSIDAVLAIGNVSETVEVTASAVVLQTDSAAVQNRVTGVEVNNQELNGRNPLFILQLLPGMRSSASMGDFNYGPGTTLPFNINGSRPQESLVTIDGAPANRPRGNGQIVGVPNVDAVEEIQVLASGYAPEYGRASGGQIRIIGKSGTRNFHGSLYEYFRNSALNANTWSRNLSPLTNFTQPATYNNFGGAVGGPVWVPGMSEKFREKLFFFVAEDWIRYRLGTTASGSVPTNLMRQGNFSELLSPNPWYSGSRIIYQPSTCKVSGAAGCVPFANNIIPASQLSYNGKAFLNALPAPTPGYQVGATNFISQATTATNQRKGNVNIDILLSPTQRLAGRRSDLGYFQDSPLGGLGLTGSSSRRPNQTNTITLTSILSATLINEARGTLSIDGSYTLANNSQLGYHRDALPIPINFPYLMPDGKDVSTRIPTITVPNFTGLSGGSQPLHSTGTIWTGADTLTKVWGNHTLKAGVGFEYSGQNDGDQINAYTVSGGASNQNGTFAFTDARTGLGATSGIGIANMALGLADSYVEIGARAYTIWRGMMWDGFIQDSWKVTPKLHVEYGLRWTNTGGFHPLWGNADYFDGKRYKQSEAVTVSSSTGNVLLGTGNPYNGVVIPGYNSFPSRAAGRIAAFTSNQCAGVSCSSLLDPAVDKNYIKNTNTFQPRLGLVYQLTPKTVVRGGVGSFTSKLALLDNIFPGGNSPFQPFVTLNNVSVDNPGALLTSGTAAPLTMTTLNPNLEPQQAWNWNFTVQRELPLKTLLSVGYVGHRGTHGLIVYDINQPTMGALLANPGVNVNALRPYKGFASIQEAESVVNSTYKALQIQWERRFTSGSSFGIAYTLAKTMDGGSTYRDIVPDTYYTSNLWGPSEYDGRHVVVINWAYALPFLKNTATLKGKLFGGWSLAGASQFQTGVPCGVGSNNDYAGVGGWGSFTCGGSGVSNGASTQGQFWTLNGPVTIDTGAFAGPQTTASSPRYFSVSATQPAAGTFNLAPGVRNSIHGPGFQNWNLSLFKSFPIDEQRGFQLRTEFYNVPNHPNLSSPNFNPTSSQFGMITSKTADARSVQLSLRLYF